MFNHRGFARPDLLLNCLRDSFGIISRFCSCYSLELKFERPDIMLHDDSIRRYVLEDR